jgi:hypothetical protein
VLVLVGLAGGSTGVGFNTVFVSTTRFSSTIASPSLFITSAAAHATALCGHTGGGAHGGMTVCVAVGTQEEGLGLVGCGFLVGDAVGRRETMVVGHWHVGHLFVAVRMIGQWKSVVLGSEGASSTSSGV